MEKIIKFIVIGLAILILLALLLIVYGMYSNISSKSSKKLDYQEDISLLLNQDEIIKKFEVIDNNLILITVEKNNNFIGYIYDINDKKITQTIKK
tara:strand:+ start:648 stop:932 length:285 start_codon:yes stop_codon:yes gene_type:complete